MRALVPQGMEGLLGAQKNLGYTSIVGSSCRLHDHCIHAGQASGAVAAVSLRHEMNPSELYYQPERLAEIWTGLLEVEPGAPLAIWPFADVDPYDPGFVAIQQLALRRVLALKAWDTSFQADQPATRQWLDGVLAAIGAAGFKASPIALQDPPQTRREAAIELWGALSSQPMPPLVPNEHEAETPDPSSPLPFSAGRESWQLDPQRDGLPKLVPPFPAGSRAFHFTSANGPRVAEYTHDSGAKFSVEQGFGWGRDLSDSTRLRQIDKGSIRDGFVFTRQEDVWECVVENGQWKVHLCVGDIGHDQPGQNVRIEDQVAVQNLGTTAGEFYEVETEATVRDGRLTVTLGAPDAENNTCLNWIILVPAPSD